MLKENKRSLAFPENTPSFSPEEEFSKLTESEGVLQLRALTEALSERKAILPNSWVSFAQADQGLVINVGAFYREYYSEEIFFSKAIVSSDGKIQLGSVFGKNKWYEEKGTKTKEEYLSLLEKGLRDSIETTSFIEENDVHQRILRKVITGMQNALFTMVNLERKPNHRKNFHHPHHEEEFVNITDDFIWTCTNYPDAMDQARYKMSEDIFGIGCIAQDQLAERKSDGSIRIRLIEDIPLEWEQFYYLQYLKPEK